MIAQRPPKKDLSCVAEIVPIGSIKPSPENDSVYGAIDSTNIDLVNLANDIAANGIREPLQISADNYIVSGHRRYAAARLVRIRAIPVTRLDLCRSDHNATEWQRILRGFNHQRVKSASVRMREAMLDLDPDIAHQQLIDEREERDRDLPPVINIAAEKSRSTISDRKQEMLAAAVKVINDLEPFWPVSVRQVHYGLLNNPPLRNSSNGKQRSWYQNDSKSYGDLCDLLTRARLLETVPWDAISDETRPTTGTRFNVDAATFADLQFHHFLRGYRRDLLQSQRDHVELVVEKLTVQGIIAPIAAKFCMPMTVGRGYCSIDPRHEISDRYYRSGKDRLILLIAADFDPDGEEIAESFARSMRDDFGIDDLVASKILLRKDQVEAWQLPHNGLEAKETSSKYRKFMQRYGDDAVYELEAVNPLRMQKAVQDAIESTIDLTAFNAELANEKQDAVMLHVMKKQIAESFPDLLENGGAA